MIGSLGKDISEKHCCFHCCSIATVSRAFGYSLLMEWKPFSCPQLIVNDYGRKGAPVKENVFWKFALMVFIWVDSPELT